ncbi:hypothetical protein STEG23_021524 [Scotinomys teguina]
MAFRAGTRASCILRSNVPQIRIYDRQWRRWWRRRSSPGRSPAPSPAAPGSPERARRRPAELAHHSQSPYCPVEKEDE